MILAQNCPLHFSVDRWIICIGGFTQKLGEQTGTHRLWLRLRMMFGEPATQIEFCQWNSDWKDIANLVLNSRGNCRPRVDIIAYSWGAGWGFTQLATLLARRGISVQTAVLCDPVYRSPWLSFRWRSIFMTPAVDVPANVGKVWVVYQDQDFPIRGCELRTDPNGTAIMARRRLVGIDHESMDETDEFYAMAQEALKT